MLDDIFELEESIGKGGSSYVYKVRDTDGNTYAAKCIRKDKKYSHEKALSLVCNEYRILKRLEGYPNIIKLVSCNFSGSSVIHGVAQPEMYNILEYAENSSLEKYIKHTGPLEEEISRFFFVQLCHAIEYIHSHKIAHLDIKPGNLFLDQYFNLKLGDFGIAEDLSRCDGYISSRKGTKYYMAPEVMEAIEEHSEYNAYGADIYSLGITLFVLVTGRLPRSGESVEDLLSEEAETKSDDKDLHLKVVTTKDKFYWMSKDLKELLHYIITSSADCRPSASDILAGPWCSKPFSATICEDVYSEMSLRRCHFMHKLSNYDYEMI